MKRTGLTFSLALVLSLALFLSGCGPETQQGPTTDSSLNVDYVGVGNIVPPEDLRSDTPDVFAAKNRVPHQYKDLNPYNFFAVFNNLNPGLNR